MSVDDYVGPVERQVRTTFLTWRAAARHMVRQRSGVILAYGGEGHPPARALELLGGEATDERGLDEDRYIVGR